MSLTCTLLGHRYERSGPSRFCLRCPHVHHDDIRADAVAMAEQIIRDIDAQSESAWTEDDVIQRVNVYVTPYSSVRMIFVRERGEAFTVKRRLAAHG